MQHTFTSFIETPIGKVTILADDDFVSEVSFDERLKNDAKKGLKNLESEVQHPNKLTAIAAAQLQEYFAGIRSQFTFPIRQRGTDFQQEVWQKLLEIPFGQTTSYAKFSSHKPLAIRAIAAANGKNNVAIVVPCHRVIGSNGKLVGYAGGLWRKQWLLLHERKIAQLGQSELEF
ncbi:methylated-DNA-[protein]-cysteine S-methyltransferase [Pedobacter sp. UYP30]|uniref:methylated-DNA--[protein]-cysteine S-methyltransferase n=1 Tax=Pedobacter sp. UYP30 TaxID=1756400 RepID=UPI0033948ACC